MMNSRKVDDFRHPERSSSRAGCWGRQMVQDMVAEVRIGMEADVESISDAIWKGPDDSFLPHCLEDNDKLHNYPIVLSKSPLSEVRDCLIVIDQAELLENEVDKFKRVCLLFDSKNEVELTNARKTWKSLSNAGVNTVYWAEDQGTWKRKK